MNPLTVLTGAMVMRGCEQMERADGALCLDEQRRYRLTLDAAGTPLELRLDGEPHAFRIIGDGVDCAADESAVIVAPATLSLQSLIELRRKTGHPVLLAEGGAVVGVCGETEIVGALAARG
jgi:glycine betaine/proline transport system ATP-binding protein